MAETLTPQQREAVENRGGRLLVSAAAGSGKTKVLVDRLMRYLTDPVQPANIDQFLMITYTKAAAAELRGKIAAKLTELVAADPENHHLQRQLQRLYLTKISTVHSFCGDVLREYAYRLDIPGDFRVADELECSEIRVKVLEKLLDEAYNSQQDNPAFRAFVDSQGLGRDDRQVPEILQQVYDSARCHLDPEQWLSECVSELNVGAISDAAETHYGQFLLLRLQKWLAQQIVALEHCVTEMTGLDGYDKPLALLADTVAQLKMLEKCTTWKEIYAFPKLDFGRLTFSKKCGDEDLNNRVKAVREACKKGLEKQLVPFSDSSEQVLSDLAASKTAVCGLTELVRSFDKAYSQAKRGRRILDFGDLEHLMLDLLLGKARSAPTAAAVEIGSRFLEVMVDEYQDSNAVQDAIYGALTSARKNLFMVGDVKQSIYQFRLADPLIFLNKYNTFTPAEEAEVGQDRKVVLSRNFRSSGGVLEAANDVFRLCMCPTVGGMYYGDDEALYEGIPHAPLGEAEASLFCIDVQQETYPEEAAFVADHIRKLLDGTHFVRQKDELRPIRPEDIVILLRSPGSAGIYFQRALDEVGIRYATGGGTDLLQTEEIGTLHAILQVIHNPRLDIPLIAAMTSPAFGFTADELAAIRSKNKKCAFFDAVNLDGSPRCKEFLEKLQQLRSCLRRHSLTQLLEKVLLTTDMEAVYGAKTDGAVRLANIQAFYQLAADFEAAGNRDLGRFLEHLEGISQKGLITAGEESSAGRVTIMSIHKSKGLEFPVVFLCGLGREFNKESQRANVLCHKHLGLGLSAVDHGNRLRYPTVAKRAISAIIGMEGVSEELRVLYVAMTRAKDRLIMTYASNRLQKDLQELMLRMEAGCLESLLEEAVCPGDWVLMTALRKTEAGALFALCGNPRDTATGTHPWDIQVVTGPQLTVAEEETPEKATLSPQQLEDMKQGLAFEYAYTAAVSAPSKQTATGIKGRAVDEEAAENTPPPKARIPQWRKPDFHAQKRSGTDYGNAMHAVMQHLDFAVCTDEAGITAEIARLMHEGFLKSEQASMVKAGDIAAFFATELGQKVRQGNVLREFKFSILEDAVSFDPALAGEKVLLQGVVDCALLEDDGITIIDFKTDRVADDTLPEKLVQYAPQVRAYANAMARIYEKPVKESYLYFFSIGKFIKL